MKKVLLLATFAATIIACSNEDVFDSSELMNSQKEKCVTLSVVTKSTSTKAVDDQKTATEYPTIAAATLYFQNSSGATVFERELTSDEITTVTNTTSTATSGNTLTITGVPSTAETLFFVANATAQETNDDGDAVIRIDLLQGDAETTAMSGTSAAFVAEAGSTTDYTATVEISPLVSRIEIGSLSYTTGSTTSEITSYQLGGVFVNNIQPYVTLEGAAADATLVDIAQQTDWATDWEKYFDANQYFPYSSTTAASFTNWSANAFADYCTQTTSAALKFYPDSTTGASTTDSGSNLAWAYQVVPAAAAASMPHLILKLTDVAYNASTAATSTRYLTVTKYKNSSDESITSFERGNLYRITDLTFTNDQTSSKPYIDDLNVTATVTVTPWIVNTITPDWN